MAVRIPALRGVSSRLTTRRGEGIVGLEGVDMTKAVTVLVVHADEQRVRGLYSAALAPLGTVSLHFVNRNGLSARYDGATGLAYEFPTVRSLLEKLAPEWSPGEPLLGIGFSAGCWALRAWLKIEESRSDFTCVLFLDGLHAALDARGQLIEANLLGVYAYADACRASNGQKLLIHQNTDIQTELCHPPYASTSMTARALLDHLKVEKRNAPDDGETAGVLVRSYPGLSGAAHVHALMQAGPELIRQNVVPFLARLLRDDERERPEPLPAIEPWRDPRLTLGQRCTLLCQQELEAKIRANQTGPNTGVAVAKYFAGAVRDGKPLGLTAGNWCMLSQSWVMQQCVLPGEVVPHLWRAGVIEAVEDAKARQLYRPIAEVRSGVFRPQPGDLAIWDRSVPGDANSSWWRHVNRVVVANDCGTPCSDDDVFVAIGGNEGNRTWVSALRKMNDPKLLGFIEYPRSVARDELPTADRWGEHEPAHAERLEVVEEAPRGIDVSRHQGVVDYVKVKQQGQSWVICRATYGTKVDETFARNWQGARAAGLRVGAYHFLRYRRDQSAELQAEAFLAALRSQIDPAQLSVPVALDVEENAKYDDPLDAVNYVAQVKVWLAKVSAATSVPPLVYTCFGFWDTLPFDPTICERHPLWVAHYTHAPKPTLPKGWKDYRIWQFTGTGRIEGVPRPVDLNQGKPWA